MSDKDIKRHVTRWADGNQGSCTIRTLVMSHGTVNSAKQRIVIETPRAFVDFTFATNVFTPARLRALADELEALQKEHNLPGF